MVGQLMKAKISIAIDGPAGAGKTTVARGIAQALGYKYVDTGAMYRTVAWKSLQMGVPLSDEASITEMTARMDIDFPEGDGSRILVDGVDVSAEIRTTEVTRLSSPISAISGVRRLLVARQKHLAGDGGVVMEGRDIGTVVMPNAEVKVFLIASIDERARRRYDEIIASGKSSDMDSIRHSIEERDNRDSTRDDSPLMRAPNAINIDTDYLDIRQVTAQILDLAREALHRKGN